MTRSPAVVPVFDSGLRGGVENIATDRRLLTQHKAGMVSDGLRFHRSLPTACVGYHQAIDRELRLDYCARHEIEIARRASGGGALYLDPAQQGLSLLVKRRGPWAKLNSAALLERFCLGLADGLSELGIEARFNFPNDLEIEGKKIASAFMAQAEDSLLLHATVLLDVDIETMLKALRAPTEKLSPDGLASARERFAPLVDVVGAIPDAAVLKASIQSGLGNRLGFEPGPRITAAMNAPAPILQRNPDSFTHRIDWSGRPGESIWTSSGGVLRARITIDQHQGAIASAQLAISGHVLPSELPAKVEDAVTGLTPCMIDGAVHRIFATQHADPVGISETDVSRVLHLAFDSARLEKRMAVDRARLMLFNASDDTPAEDILAHANVMLVPYCAKPVWCKWRHLEGCPECGMCDVGEAYRLGRERGMTVTTITSYEHLVATLSAMKNAGTRAYIGMCCSNFFIKRHRAFRDAGMPAVLMDISGSNCYELQQESAAYAGKFEAQASLDNTVLWQIMKFVPGSPGGNSSSPGKKEEGLP